MLLLLLSRFSHVRLCATPQTAAHQAPPSLGFSRQEHWSGLPFPSPMHGSESEVAQWYLTLLTPWTAAYQTLPSMGFSRQKYWSGVPSAKKKKKGGEDMYIVANSRKSLRIFKGEIFPPLNIRCHLSFLICIALITPDQNDIFL